MVSSSDKPVMVLAMDEHEHSSYALKWTLDRFFTHFGSDAPFNLVIVNAKPSPPVAVNIAGSEVQLNLIADQVAEKAKQICASKLVYEVLVEAVEGDARNVLCDAVERHKASVLVLGSHGYGPIKRTSSYQAPINT